MYLSAYLVWIPLLALLAGSQTGSHAWPIRQTTILRHVRVGADHSPPYYYLRPGGKVEGLGVDVLDAAASRAGITLEWLPSGVLLDDGFDSGRLDIFPAASSTPWRQAKYHFTEPWLINNFCLISRSGSGITKPADTAGRRVSIWSPQLFHKLARQYLPSAAIVRADSREEALTDVCSGLADSAMLETRFLDSAMLNRPRPCDGIHFQVAIVPQAQTQFGIASTRQAAATAELLRDSIAELAWNGTLSRIMERWATFSSSDSRSVYALAEAQRRNRLYMYGVALLLALGILLASQFLRAHAARRRAKIAQRAAEDANAAKTDFLANMSHEIRTPLNGVIGMTNLVLDGSLTEAKRRDLETIRDSAHMLLTIMNDILDLSKIEAGRVTISPVPFRLRSTVGAVIGLFTPQAKSKGLALTWSCDQEIPENLRGDVVRVQQILGNYVANAVKFTWVGAVDLCVRVMEQHADKVSLRFSVTDTGIGIPLDIQPKLFAKFVQADPSTSRKYGGTGLGLAISKTLAELMGGSVGLESEVDEGSNFWVDLPFQIESPTEALASRVHEQELTGLSWSPRVLVVEDNEVNRRIALSLLAKLGCIAETAVNGREGLRKYLDHCYDVILMDCQMPEMDGYEATAAIRNRENGELRVPIIAVTAHALADDEERCRRAGMDEYLCKPIQLAQLAKVIEKYAGVTMLKS